MRRPLAAALALCLAVRACAIAWLPASPAWDGAIYARLAAHLAAGLGYVDAPSVRAPLGPTAFYPVGYPAALAALLPVTGEVRVAAWAVNVLAALVAAACAVALAHRLAGPRAAWVAGMTYAVYPGAALWCAAAMTETVTGALLALACVAALRAGPALPSRGAWAAAAGVVVGLATLVRPQSLLVAPLAGAAAPGGARARLAGAAVALALALAVCAPWTARNCRALDACALVSTNGGSNLLIGTFPDARGGYRRPGAADGCRAVRGEVARDRCMAAAALGRIRARPLAWAALGAWKLARTFVPEVDPASYARATAPTPLGAGTFHALAAACTLAWLALVALATRGGAALFRRGDAAARAGVALLAGAAGAVAVTHGVFLGADRYHLALVPLLVPLAAAGAARGARA